MNLPSASNGIDFGPDRVPISFCECPGTVACLAWSLNEAPGWNRMITLNLSFRLFSHRNDS